MESKVSRDEWDRMRERLSEMKGLRGVDASEELCDMDETEYKELHLAWFGYPSELEKPFITPFSLVR